METTMQVTAVRGTVGYTHMLFFRPPTLVQRHVCVLLTNNKTYMLYGSVYSGFSLVLKPNLHLSFFRIWQSSWSKLASLSISHYLKNKTLTCGFFSL